MKAKFVKPLAGVIVAFIVGFVCRVFGIPSPAPPVIVGGLMVMAMTVGYLLVDRAMSSPAQRAGNRDGTEGASTIRGDGPPDAPKHGH